MHVSDLAAGKDCFSACIYGHADKGTYDCGFSRSDELDVCNAEVRLSDGLPMLPDAEMTQMLDCNNGSQLVKRASKRLQFCCIGVYICR